MDRARERERERGESKIINGTGKSVYFPIENIFLDILVE